MNPESKKKELSPKELIKTIVALLVGEKFSTAQYVMSEVIKTMCKLTIVGAPSIYKKAIKCGSCHITVIASKSTCTNCGEPHLLENRLIQPEIKKSVALTTDS